MLINQSVDQLIKCQKILKNTDGQFLRPLRDVFIFLVKDIQFTAI